MGSGIAQWFAARGMDVLLRDVDATQLAGGLQRAEKLFADARRRGLLSSAEAQAGMDRIVPAELPMEMKLVDLVVEAALEKMELKKQIFADLEERTRPDTLLATNTSALSVTEISRGLQHPERVAGLHFFNPVHRMKLVEVVRAEETSGGNHRHRSRVRPADWQATCRRAGSSRLSRESHSTALSHRGGSLCLRRALMFSSLDESMLDFGMPMGPLRLLDEVGLDVASDVARSLCAAFPSRMQVPEIFEKFLARGIQGRKAGDGIL